MLGVPERDRREEFRLRVIARMRETSADLPTLAILFTGVVRPNLLAVWRNRGRIRPIAPGGDRYWIGDVLDEVAAMRAAKAA